MYHYMYIPTETHAHQHRDAGPCCTKSSPQKQPNDNKCPHSPHRSLCLSVRCGAELSMAAEPSFRCAAEPSCGFEAILLPDLLIAPRPRRLTHRACSAFEARASSSLHFALWTGLRAQGDVMLALAKPLYSSFQPPSLLAATADPTTTRGTAYTQH
jgi:hypothetical protein